MSERFRFDEAFYPVPAAAIDANPAGTIKDLLYRVSKLEENLEEQHAQATSDLADLLLEIISFSDDLTMVAERWGVATKAQDAAIIGGVVALGRRLVAILKRHQVEAVNTIGEPFDPSTSDIAATETSTTVPPNVVLREMQVGYSWPNGLLRRAKVVVSAPGAAAKSPSEPAAPAPNATEKADEAPNASGE